MFAIKNIFCAALILLLTLIYCNQVHSQPTEYYASRYDHLDVETILNNRRMVNYYAACLLSQGPCPPQGLEFKRILPEALRTNCRKCTEKQKTVTYRSIKRLKKEYPKVWSQLTAIWDPDDVYVKRFEASFEEGNSITNPKEVFIGNRFGASDEDGDTEAPPTSAKKTTPLVLPLSNPALGSTASTTTTSTSAAPSTSRASSTPVASFVTTTNRPTTTPFRVTQKFTTTTSRVPTFGTIGSNIQATVSFGADLVGGIVKNLGSLGSQVIETGSKFANAVISAVIRPPPPLIQ